MVLIHCNRCNIDWDYKGTNELYATHSKCRSIISIRKHRVEVDKSNL